MTAWRLRAYGFVMALFYAVLMVNLYDNGNWITDRAGTPVYNDFSTSWVAGFTALHGITAALYDSEQFVKIQRAVLGIATDNFYPNWPYPPTFSLLLAPLGLLPYVAAFLAWTLSTLAGLAFVIYGIARRSAAIAVLLASPFTAWNFFAGQNGFLTGALLGAGLLTLERQPLIAGVFIGCLTYKPQWGLLIPVALVAGRQWRAFVSATLTFGILSAISIAAFGLDPWKAFPYAIVHQSGVVLDAGGRSETANWGIVQTVYGLIRWLHGGATLAWCGQLVSAVVVAVIVYRVWRSSIRYELKAATLSLAMFFASPYGFAYDLAALAVPIAFLVKDQIDHGCRPTETGILFALFGMVLTAFFFFGARPGRTMFGAVPLACPLVITLLVLGMARVNRAFRDLHAIT